MTKEQARILVVDDDEKVRTVIQRILTEAGYDVVTAANGQEALNKMRQLKVIAVLLDIKMPGISGIEILQRISTNWPETRVVMATGVADVETAVKAMTSGAYDYITKPFDPTDLVMKLQRAIDKKGSTAASIE